MKELDRPLPPELEALKPIVRGIAATMGRSCEVLIHDFANPQNSLVVIAGHVTGRSVGAPITERLLQALHTEGDAAADILNVKIRTSEGRILKSSTIFIRDQTGKVIGSLGINLDLSDLDVAWRVIAAHFNDGWEVESDSLSFATDINDLVDNLLESAIHLIGKPLALMDRDDRIGLIHALDGRGYFRIRGSVEEVAKRMGVTRYTVYSYLDEVRKGSGKD